MKKSFPLILIVIAAVGIGYSFIKTPSTSTGPSVSVSASTPSGDQAGAQGGASGGMNAERPVGEGVDTVAEEGGAEQDGMVDEVKPVAVAFKNADDALEALKKGAKDYDDLLLEQFTTPGEDCTFCPELYGKVKDLLKSTEVPNDQKSYLAEILAISGRPENVQAIVDNFKASTKAEDKEVYGAALELVTGGDSIVKLLANNLSTDNTDLQESVVAALTNQGSALAFQTMMKHVADKGDPDGYYSLGIGPGEMILEDAALPLAQEAAQKRDGFSPLAVKALLNSGISGLRIVMDVIGNSNDAESNNKLLKDAVEHVNYDEQVEQYLKDQANSSNPSVREFANKILNDFAQAEATIDDGTGGPMQSMMPGVTEQ